MPSSEEPRGIPSEASSACQTRDELETLRAQLALAVGVLKPFADAFDINSADGDCLDLSDWEAMLNHICIHDFRKASRTLAALSPQEELEEASRAESVTPLASQGGDTEAQSPAGGGAARFWGEIVPTEDGRCFTDCTADCACNARVLRQSPDEPQPLSPQQEGEGE